jgi:dTDP-4-dehydrorhamnose 3,5-epimerase
MNVIATELPGVLVVEPRVFGDERGWFLETWRAERYREHGIGPEFVQANCSQSTRGVLRGLHYQWPEPQGKLVWVTAGSVLDVAVDIRPDSDTFGQWTAVELDAESHRQLWIPGGFRPWLPGPERDGHLQLPVHATLPRRLRRRHCLE